MQQLIISRLDKPSHNLYQTVCPHLKIHKRTTTAKCRFEKTRLYKTIAIVVRITLSLVFCGPSSALFLNLKANQNKNPSALIRIITSETLQATARVYFKDSRSFYLHKFLRALSSYWALWQVFMWDRRCFEG